MSGYLPYNPRMGTVNNRNADTHAAARNARLEARITGAQKSLFQRAAALSGRSLSDFVVSSVQEAASRAIREHEIMAVTGADRDRLVSALLDAPEPGQRLRRAAQRYKTAANGS